MENLVVKRMLLRFMQNRVLKLMLAVDAFVLVKITALDFQGPAPKILSCLPHTVGLKPLF